MNKFLKKRADGANASDEALPSPVRPSSPTPKKPSTSRWKKTKKEAPEVRPQIDLSIALPSTDEFRTSLIMPSLSTRFSMLREQDDPSSILGKASDDSVLQPRRKSRMADFGFPSTGLTDIAEVSSLYGSFRPPFTQENREHSYLSEDGYGSDVEAIGGSVMSRSRPGEGNILFGGRQKVYKIPTSGAASTKSLGKLVYDDDVGISAFQKYRQREREEDESHFPRPSNESQGFDFGLDKVEPDDQDDGQRSLLNDSAKDLSHSPSLSSYDRKRSTTSSDGHSVARSSTAATSIASQPAISSSVPSPAYAPVTSMASAPTAAPVQDRSNTKGRRLYEQGLDQHIQDQQTSAITRLNSIQRQRAMSGKNTPPFLQSTKSAGNLQDRLNQPMLALRGQSPPLISASLGSIKRANSASSSPVPSASHSPMEGQFDEFNVLAQALEPGDRGKATAMGAFNKPAHAFDEQQYLERQKQLQRSTSSAAVKNKVPPFQQSAFQQRIDRYEDERPERPPKRSPDPSSRARSPSTSQHEPTKAYTVFQNAVNQFPVKPSPPSASKPPFPDPHRTFFGNISASEDEDEEEVSEIARSFNQPEYGYGGYHSKWQPTPLPSVSEHPALREEKSTVSLKEEPEAEEPLRPHLRQKASTRSLRHLDAKPGALVPRDLDSPTLGPQSQALTGMVHHLRQKSNNSSIYPTDNTAGAAQDESLEVSDVPWNAAKTDSFGHGIGSALHTHQPSIRSSHYTASNPWDLDDVQSGASSAVGQPERRSEVFLLQEGTSGDRSSEVSSYQSSVPSWQHELQKQQHTRDPSNATLQDREAFSRDLAARRDAIRENLKSYVETNNSRSASPVPGAPGPLRAFGMIRAKSSGESLATMRDQHSKVLKSNASVNSLGKDERSGFSLDLARPRGNSSSRPPMPPPVSQHPAFKNEVGDSIRENENSELPKERQLASSRSPALSAARNRSRSNSATTTGRSRSRTGPYRDDLEKAMTEGRGSSATAHEPTPEASPAIVPSDRDSDGSRAGMQAYFDLKVGLAVQNLNRLAPNGPVSAPQQSNVYTPGRPAPVANPYTSNATPPLSASSNGTPVSASPATFTPEAFSPILSTSARPSAPLRRKTISKSDISEPTLISSTSNVDTVDLPPGASLKNGMEQPPPIPPINPRRRGTRKLFGLGSSKDASDKENELPKLTQSDPNLLLQSSPKRSDQGLFPPSNVVRMPPRQETPALQQYGFSQAESPEGRGPTRAVTAPMGDGGMF